MTKESTYKPVDNSALEYHKLSIQVGLNGLSFCVLDTISNAILSADNVDFGKELSLHEVLKELKLLVNQHDLQKFKFSEVVAVHRNNLFSLVPKVLFDEKELPNYLKFNAKILANDLIAFDEMANFDMVNVYVPFVNINNYLYDLYGEFKFMHSGSVLLQTLLTFYKNGDESICYVYVANNQMEIAVVSDKHLLLFNSFEYRTQEDFIYYILFTLEQLKFDPSTIKLRLFGDLEQGDELYDICYEYVQNVSVYLPSNSVYQFENVAQADIDFTVLNAL